MLDQSAPPRHICAMQTVPRIFDTELRQKRIARARARPDFLAEAMLDNISDRVGFIARRFSNALLLGEGIVWPALAERQTIAPQLPVDGHERFDLIVCAGLLHVMEDVPGFLVQLMARLAPDGFFVACFPGGDTLAELRACLLSAESDITGGAAQRVHPMIEVRDGGALLQRAGFAMPVADIERTAVTYAQPLDLLRELRALGETSVLVDRPRRFLRRAVLARAMEIYVLKYSLPSGRITATLSLVNLSGWSPAENQPKPKPRGSATVSLAAALKK